MKITNVRGNVYKIEEMTEGKLLSLYWALDDKRKAHNGYLGSVDYDCWLQLTRFFEDKVPAAVRG